jgi:hypothetical protein
LKRVRANKRSFETLEAALEDAYRHRAEVLARAAPLPPPQGPPPGPRAPSKSRMATSPFVIRRGVGNVAVDGDDGAELWTTLAGGKPSSAMPMERAIRKAVEEFRAAEVAAVEGKASHATAGRRGGKARRSGTKAEKVQLAARHLTGRMNPRNIPSKVAADLGTVSERHARRALKK